MLGIRKKKVLDETFINVVRGYLDWVDANAPMIQTTDALCELLRHTLCVVLDLRSESATMLIAGVSEKLAPYMRTIIPSRILYADEDKRQGFLEACVLSVGLAREKIDG